jgi:hypothetical protein
MERHPAEKSKKSYYSRLLRKNGKHIDSLIDGFFGKDD